MKPNAFSWILVLFLFLNPNIHFGQDADAEHSLFLLSNLESLSANAPEFATIERTFENEKGNYTVLVNGDFIDENGFETEGKINEKEKLDRLLSLVSDNGKIIFVPGDREWDDGGESGFKKVKALEEYLESKKGNKKILFPQKGCLGPEIIDIGDNLRIVAINSQWILQEDNRPEEEDAHCKVLNENEFWGELEDALTDSENKNLVVVSHHPARSYGQYAGYKLIRQHFLPPVIGSMIASYHQNIGNRKDLNNQKMRNFRAEMRKRMDRHPGAILVSGHEYDLQVIYENGNYHINSGAIKEGHPVGRGSGTLYRQQSPGFVKLVFHDNGIVKANAYSILNQTDIQKSFEQILFSSPCEEEKNLIPVNTFFNPCLEKITSSSLVENETPLSGTGIASARYKAGRLKQFFLGKHYRSVWGTPINEVPYLDLEKDYGGLIPYAKGGGAQTLSLKFKSNDGQRYVFRYMDKTPTQRKDQELTAGLYGKYVQDLTSSQYPYGPALIGTLLDELELLYPQPQLFIMPDSPRLGPFRKQFAGKFGWLEFKPKGKKKGRKAYKEVDKVVSSFHMYRKLLDDNDNQIAVEDFVKARIFDIWISDWDRHENNWKWLGYKGKKGYTYYPFLKDRDKALSVLHGFSQILDWEFVAPDMANFKNKIRGLKSLNFKNRSMDRWLANSFTHENWMDLVKEIQSLMTDEMIEKAVLTVPKEVQDITRQQVGEVLKKRRNHLPKAINKYYHMLAKYIDLVGSNSREYFELTRLGNGDVHAKIFKLSKKGKQGKQIYDRVIKKKETKEIRLHGLGKDDHFKIKGTTNKSILIRIIGGDGVDKIEDESKVSGLRKMTKIYDKREQDQLVLGQESEKKKTPEILKLHTNNIFNYNHFLILPTFGYNEDDGFIIGFNGKITRQGFNKPGFSQLYHFHASVTTNKNYDVGMDLQLRRVIGKWDLVGGVNAAGRDRNFQRFYGYGNETTIDKDLDANSYYENATESFETYLGVKREFWEKSSFSVSLLYDFKDVMPNPVLGSSESIYDLLPLNNGLGETSLLGPQMILDFDFRDNKTFPTKGMQFKNSNYTFLNSDENWGLGGRVESELLAYITKGIKIPVTLSLRGGFSKTYGEAPFYYNSFLGQQANHRGFLRNRFGGDSALFLNTDLRFHFGTWVNSVIPIKSGVFGLYDVGRVWTKDDTSERFRYAYGGGFYLVPYTESFNLTFTFARSDEEDMLFSFGFGFFVR